MEVQQKKQKINKCVQLCLKLQPYKLYVLLYLRLQDSTLHCENAELDVFAVPRTTCPVQT